MLASPPENQELRKPRERVLARQQTLMPGRTGSRGEDVQQSPFDFLKRKRFEHQDTTPRGAGSKDENFKPFDYLRKKR